MVLDGSVAAAKVQTPFLNLEISSFSKIMADTNQNSSPRDREWVFSHDPDFR